MKTRKRPTSARILTQWVDAYARQHGQPASRVRNWISHMMVAGALERGGFDADGRKFTIKGGVALEMRLRDLARATKDLDLVLLSDDGEPVAELGAALSQPYEGFSFGLRGAPHVMPNGASRLEVWLQYLGKSWGTVQVDVSRYEGAGTEVEMVDAISLAQFGLDGPEALPCLSLPYHVAQKIHGMTLPPPPGRRNERFRDLVDLLLLRQWITDFESVRRACLDVFATRGTHPWPPLVAPPEHWLQPFRAMAEDLGLETCDLNRAADEIRRLIEAIDPPAEPEAQPSSPERGRTRSWYFAIAHDGTVRQISADVVERFFPGHVSEPRAGSNIQILEKLQRMDRRSDSRKAQRPRNLARRPATDPFHTSDTR